jgi:membrane fusion protein (multidrug efflux system)
MPRKVKIRVGISVLAFLVVVGGAAYWYYIGIFVGTDDAYVTGHVGVISAKVPGRVKQVSVDNNHLVAPDQLIVTLDPRDYQTALAQANASLDRWRQEMAQRYVKVAVSKAKVARYEANMGMKKADKWRYTQLHNQELISQQHMDQANTQFSESNAELEQSRHELAEALAAIGGNVNIPLEEQTVIKEAKAQLEQARLNLEYTRIVADITGYIIKRQVQPGNWVKPGQPLMMIVPLGFHELWIEANYKETQLTHICVGQPATVRVDTYPGHEFKGRVDSMMSGTGVAFSILPPENATGNWVKIVQRIPVKIELLPPFPENQPLRLGMSALVTIDTRERSGPRLLPHRKHHRN